MFNPNFCKKKKNGYIGRVIRIQLDGLLTNRATVRLALVNLGQNEILRF